MNKNTLIIVISILIIFFGIYLRRVVNGQANDKNTLNTPITPTPVNPLSKNILSLDIEINGLITRVSLLRVDSPRKIALYPNFSDSLTSVQAKEYNLCSSLVSGGFYTTDNTPIGLFVSEGRQISSFAKNQLFNGIYYINYENFAQITSQLPSENLRLGLQTGPYLIKNSEILELANTSGEFARRVIVATSEDQETIFMIFYLKDSIFKGPRLSDLPGAINQISEKIGVTITNAINLDGGSASAFLAEGVNLSEITQIGSYFCIK